MNKHYEDVKFHQTTAYTIADSPQANSVKKLIKIPDTDIAENDLSELLKLIPDADLRERIDTAAGRIAYAYEKLGFVEGFVLKSTLQ